MQKDTLFPSCFRRGAKGGVVIKTNTRCFVPQHDKLARFVMLNEALRSEEMKRSVIHDFRFNKSKP